MTCPSTTACVTESSHEPLPHVTVGDRSPEPDDLTDEDVEQVVLTSELESLSLELNDAIVARVLPIPTDFNDAHKIRAHFAPKGVLGIHV